jgi:cyclophilin family peptidyl-prolyl cis-trans isomerase/HEAT repeat protein
MSADDSSTADVGSHRELPHAAFRFEVFRAGEIGHHPCMKRAPWTLLLVSSTLFGCGSMGRAPRSQAVPSAPAPVAAVQDPLESIARFEDMRTDGDGLIEALAVRGEERTRVRAVRALGRLPLEDFGASVSGVLAAALDDEDANVVEAAAFALGMRADPATVGALLSRASAGTPAVRARSIEALSRIDDARARRAVIDAIGSPDAEVVWMAAIGVHRFRKSAPESATAETALVRHLADPFDPANASTWDDEARWRALSTLARRAFVGARAEFERASSSTDPRARIFAAQGLGALPADARSVEILRECLADPDWRVACEAANALGKLADSGSIPALLVAAERATPALAAPHVRRTAFEALGRIPAAADVARTELNRGRADASPSVRAAAIEACARLYADAFGAELETAARDVDPVVRAGVAAALAHVSIDTALPTLDLLVRDPDLRVATTAVEGFATHVDDPRGHERIRALLAANDNGIRLAAAIALKTAATSADLPALQAALGTTRGEIAPEVAAAIVDAAAHVGGDDALPLLRYAIANPDTYVARRARAASLAIEPDARLPRIATPPRRVGALPLFTTGPNPRIAFETTRGTLVFELLPDEAPFHVANVLELARRGHYDGTRIHRVVPDFVVQGGDVRGDGNGGTTWRSDAQNFVPVRGEFGPRPFRRGSLGMPRNDDPDSGGSQIFVTHRETPHLDGRYTLFGEIVSGLDVLDALQVGDVILRVREVPGEG